MVVFLKNKTKVMSIAEIKIELSRRLLEVEDKKVLTQIETILNDALATKWHEVPAKIKAEIHESTSQLDNGKFISNQEIFSQVKERWNTKSSGHQKRKKASSK